jgi:hypothetical protein
LYSGQITAITYLGYLALKNFLKHPCSRAIRKIVSRVCSLTSLLIEKALDAVETETWAKDANLDKVIITVTSCSVIVSANFQKRKHYKKHFETFSLAFLLIPENTSAIILQQIKTKEYSL